MSLPYFPMYPTDFEADTSHLTLAEDGAYNRLLRLMWMTSGCSLPNDDAWIKRRMRVDQATYDDVVAVVIEEFFTRSRGRITNPKLAKIFKETSVAHKKRVDAGSKGGTAKAAKTKDKVSSKAKAMLKQPEPEPEPYKKEDTNVSLSAGPDVIAEAARLFVSQAEQSGWPTIKAPLSKARSSALRARLRECGGLDGWRIALEKAAASSHCCGDNNRGWVLTFDFITKQSSFAKLMEGNYDNRTGTNSQATSNHPRAGGYHDSTLAAFADLANSDTAGGSGDFEACGGFEHSGNESMDCGSHGNDTHPLLRVINS
jgi:uncharacterized protein YdaU (DUF1376 family)